MSWYFEVPEKHSIYRFFQIVLVAGLVNLPVNAETPEPGSDVGEQTRATLMNFTKFLSSQKSFSYTAEMGYEAVQSSGLRLEFGATRKVTVQRPNLFDC